MNADDDMEITLPILQTIEQQSHMTQRGLAKRLGLALGLTNSYLKHCISKGLVKIEQIPANRYLYYLTPKGFAEKSRLMAEHLSRSFRFYRRASDSCLKIFTECRLKNRRDVVLYGISDLAEIAVLQAARAAINVLGIFDPSSDRDTFLDYSVWRKLPNLPPESVYVITTLEAPLRAKQELACSVDADCIFVPDILAP
ncbi:winged helix-turn-helix transcriptional regulator [Candidiatus Paracoxiella cheracis]|uniref:winged helix-turn-helix transcriptional regulator n=1 Tax=Candidiatus Paracoxiella cheracis TaxID=3405120 RepID=UPI003BF60057